LATSVCHLDVNPFTSDIVPLHFQRPQTTKSSRNNEAWSESRKKQQQKKKTPKHHQPKPCKMLLPQVLSAQDNLNHYNWRGSLLFVYMQNSPSFSFTHRTI